MISSDIPTSAVGTPAYSTQPMGEVIQIDQAVIRKHLSEVVRSTVEETLNAMLDAEADQLCKAKLYEQHGGVAILAVQKLIIRSY